MSRYLAFCLCSILIFFSGCYRTISDPAIVPPISMLAFNGPDTVWLITNTEALLRSEDGGKNWVDMDMKPYGFFKAMTFLNKNLGWAVNEKGQVWSTKDTGNSWELLATLNYDKAPFIGPLEEIHFIDELNGWIVDPFSLWNTSDGGITWRKIWIAVEPDQEKELVYQLHPVSKDVLWLKGEKQGVYYSEDGGNRWEKRNIEISDTDINTIFFVSNKVCWAGGGPKGGIYKTEDGGKSWQKQNLPAVQPNLYSIHFINEQEGWAAGRSVRDEKDKSSPTQGLVLHTIDGGKTWEKVMSPENDEYYKDINLSGEGRGWLFSAERVYRTNDKGKSWEKVLEIARKY